MANEEEAKTFSKFWFVMSYICLGIRILNYCLKTETDDLEKFNKDFEQDSLESVSTSSDADVNNSKEESDDDFVVLTL